MSPAGEDPQQRPAQELRPVSAAGHGLAPHAAESQVASRHRAVAFQPRAQHLLSIRQGEPTQAAAPLDTAP